MSENLHFKTHVQLKSIIGKDLINDDNIAILELVKNAYDANSKRVLVSFKNIKANDDNELSKIGIGNIPYTSKTSKIVIQDFGTGMNKQDIVDKWLNIAYSEKKSQKKKYDRILAGAKGVGRFSCDRLGEFLDIYSRKSGQNIVHIFIDWKKFEVDDKDLLIQGIDVYYEEIRPADFEHRTGYPLFEKGTILEINKLRSNWTNHENNSWSTDTLIGLRKQLEKLINPNQAYIQESKKSQNTFNIDLFAEEFIEEDIAHGKNHKINGEIKNKIFEKLDFKTTTIVAEIDKKGKTLTTTLQDKGKTIFKLVERNNYYSKLFDTHITLYYLSPYSKAYFTRQMGLRPFEFGSIYLFVNGFRVPPYGEAGDDWLKIDVRKGQGFGRYLGTREVIGRIEITDENGNFQIISSREGVVKNESYHELADRDTEGFFYKTFKRLENYVIDGVNWDRIPEDSKKRWVEIEKRIFNYEFGEEEEVYLENDSDKFKRVYDLIHTIINTKPKDVISLYVNEDLILQRVKEEKDAAEKEFEEILNNFSNNTISIESLNRVLARKAENNADLQQQLKEFAKYTTEETTTKAILELESLKELNHKQEKTIKELIAKIEKLEEEQNEQVEEIKQKEKEVLFHQKLLTKEVVDLLEYHHVIGICADTIDKHLVNLQNDLNKNKIPSKQELIELIESISFESKKISSLTNLATSANFSADADEIDTDLAQFISQYATNLELRTYDSDILKITVENTENLNFAYHFKPIEIAIIFDNLFSNSRKAKATNINISFKKENENDLLVFVKDNGKIGIRPEIQDKIFDFGFTTTSGSGMGLNHVKKLLNEKYNGEIILNKNSNIGTEFIITFSK